MNLYYLFVSVVAWTTALMGMVVFLTNTRSSLNRQFFFTTLVVTAWLLCIGTSFLTSVPAHIQFWIKQSSAVGAFHPANFFLLHLCIFNKHRPWLQVMRSGGVWLLSALLMAGLAQTDFFLADVTLTTTAAGRPGVPEPVYGPGFLLYNLYYVVAIIGLTVLFIRDIRRTQGVKRAEIQFLALAVIACVMTGMVFAMGIPLLTGTSVTILIAPVCAVLLVAIVAYGIATQRIMDVTEFIQRIVSFVLLLVYLTGLYYAVWFAASRLMGPYLQRFPYSTLPNLAAALVVAVALAPARGRLRSLASGLFVSGHAVDLERTMEHAGGILQSVSRLDALLASFADLIKQSMGTDRTSIFLRAPGRYELQYIAGHPDSDTPPQFPDDHPLPALLRHSRAPLVPELMDRAWPTPHRAQVSKVLQEHRVAAAVGIFHKDQLEGFMLLGPLPSGRIYGATEQYLLTWLSNQLGIAIENARLYTEVQDSKIYHDILLDNLTSGVVAANLQGGITAFNREAQRMTGLQESETVGHSITCLPAPLQRALQSTLTTRREIPGAESALTVEGTEITIRAGTTLVRDHHQEVIGALVLFNDTTRTKVLEEQIRRHDRLASIGTLSAGMAHEIKNPLVSIKTFTDLLPAQYDDPEFRHKFSVLVGSEVKRIDRIVNQLLRFARPAKADLTPISLHDTLDHALSLIEQSLRQQGIAVVKAYGAVRNTIQGDAHLLNQAFINFFLNAIDAMPEGGRLTLTTRAEGVGKPSDLYAQDTGDMPPRLHLSIEDTGIGIAPEDAKHVFDPFYTTKSSGTGMGLAVAHGILLEHQATVHLRSQPGRGTALDLAFPLHSSAEVPA